MVRYDLPPEFIHCVGLLETPCAALAFHARLPNGKRTIAFVEQRDAELLRALAPGCRVHLAICPADFERARITGVAQESEPEQGEA